MTRFAKNRLKPLYTTTTPTGNTRATAAWSSPNRLPRNAHSSKSPDTFNGPSAPRIFPFLLVGNVHESVILALSASAFAGRMPRLILLGPS